MATSLQDLWSRQTSADRAIAKRPSASGSALTRALSTSQATPQYEQVEPKVLETEGQKQARTYLQNALSNPVATYSGKAVADLPFEAETRATLSDYIGRDRPELYGQAQDVLSRTLTEGGFDPNTSQYYQGVKQTADLNLSDALNRYGRQQYLKGNLRSTPTDAGQARLIAENTANLNTVLGQLALQERQNQVQGINQAMQLGQLQDRFGLDTLNAIQGITPLLQAQEQKQLDFDYQEWLRQQQQPLSLAQLLYSQPVTYSYPQYRQVA